MPVPKTPFFVTDFVTWNLTPRGEALRRHDAYFVSYPKSGRTWVRFFYYSYLTRLTGRASFSWNPADFPGHPAVAFEHDRWTQRMKNPWWRRLAGRDLIPPDVRTRRPVILMARDPRDVVVSHYFHLLKRENDIGWTRMPLAEMIRDPRFGLPHIVERLNAWRAEWENTVPFLCMRYEDCQAEPVREFRSLLQFLGAPVDESVLKATVDYCRFENMQAMEASGTFEDEALRATDPRDVDSYKARRGKVGGFRDHFSPEDLAYAAGVLQQLDPRYGYRAES